MQQNIQHYIPQDPVTTPFDPLRNTESLTAYYREFQNNICTKEALQRGRRVGHTEWVRSKRKFCELHFLGSLRFLLTNSVIEVYLLYLIPLLTRKIGKHSTWIQPVNLFPIQSAVSGKRPKLVNLEKILLKYSVDRAAIFVELLCPYEFNH